MYGFENTPEGRAIREKMENEKFWFTMIGTALVISLLVGSYACYGNMFYGDWKCGFVECRIIVEQS